MESAAAVKKGTNSMVSAVDTIVESYGPNVFFVSLATMYLLYAFVVLGITSAAPSMLQNVELFVKVFVSLFLMLRYNPFRTAKFTDTDSRIIFSCALFLLTTTGVQYIVIYFLNRMQVLMNSYF